MKRQICIALTVFLLTASGGGFVYGAETQTANTSAAAVAANIVPDMNFVGPEISLSLKQATDRLMTSSSGITDAKLKLAQDNAATETSAREVSQLNRQEKEARGGSTWASTPTVMQKEIASLTADYRKTQAQNNYNAAVNNLKSQLIKTYYETLQAKDQVRIGQENVTIQETLLKNVKLKYTLGTASKQDTLQAEVALNQKKVALEGYQNELTIKQMGFNQYFEYPLMKKITLTESLTAAEASKITLADAIKSALTNRTELAAAKYGVEYGILHQKDVDTTYPRSEGASMQAKADLMKAENTRKDTPLDIEIDVRSKYLQMKAAKSAIDANKSSVDMTKESFRLMQRSYDAGLKTLTDVQQSQVAAYDAEILYSQSILAYNLAVMAYEQSTTVGTKAF